MNDNRPGKFKIWAPFVCALVLVVGMILGFNLRDTLRSKRDIQTVATRNDRLEQIIDLVSEKYVDSVNPNVLYEDAINGILSHLDPHTLYIPADQFEGVTESLEGSFFGIGVEFSIIDDTIQVTAVNEGGPAALAGMSIGDKLLKVGDSVVAGRNITSERIIKMLKGKQYSRVYITLMRAGSNEQKAISVKRDIIPLYSIDASIMVDSVTGYIKISRFSSTTYQEFVSAVKKLKAANMRSLIIDVRQNPGGYLDAAVNIADELLGDDKLVVYTEGKSSARKEYKTGRKGDFETGKVAILVDESSASASEILAGAIQDWDRGLVIGRRTYGKGLVQEQYDMDNGAGLRLTIAKYYTPSGRSIQRPFLKGKEAYDEDFLQRFSSGELTGNDSVFHGDTTRFFTSRQRVVYGGGGITPDVYVGYDTSRLSNAMLNLVYSDDMKNHIWSYFLKHRAELSEYKNVNEFATEFDDNILIRSYIVTLPLAMKRMAVRLLSNSTNMSYMQKQMKAQLARMIFRNNGYYAIITRSDNMVQRALRELNSEAYLTLINR